MAKEEFIRITPDSANKNYLRDLRRYNELFMFIAWRDILVRYKQTAIGISWSLLRPFLTMVIFTVVFGRIAQLPSDGVPYPILIFSALLPWNFFANSFSEASNSLLENSHLLSRIYFPKIIIPTSSIIVSLVDFAIAFLIFVGLMIWYRFTPTINILLLPLFLFWVCILSLGCGYIVSAINVKYRDFRYVIPFIIQIGLYISPVGFSSNIVPEKWMFFYSLNPLTGIIEGFRWAIIGTKSAIYIPGIIMSILLSVVIFIIGFIFFRNSEKKFADII